MAQTFLDKLVSGAQAIRYSVTEPLLLKLARRRNERHFTNAGDEPLISVYIPTYNRAALLMERSVPSVLAQTYDRFELVVVGDHTTDETENLVTKIADPRVQFHNIGRRGYRYPPTAENHWLAGPVVAANTALGMLKGKWIARIDDDDLWTPDHLESLLHFAQQTNMEFVSSLYEEERHQKVAVVDGDVADGPYLNRGAISPGTGPKIGGTQTWLYRQYLRLFRYNIHCWRKNWNRVNDIDLQVRMYKAGVRMGFLEKLLARVIPRPGEETVGLEAYISQAEKKEEHFKFSL